MPITQDRMEKVVAAGETFQTEYLALAEAIRAAVEKAKREPSRAAEAMDDLALQLLGRQAELWGAEKIILLERQHFRLTRSRNISERERLRRKRGGLSRQGPSWDQVFTGASASEIAEALAKDEAGQEPFGQEQQPEQVP